MPHSTGLVHIFAFHATPGLTLGGFSIDIFTRDGVAVSSETAASLAVTEIGSGYYKATYTPNEIGNYILALSDGTHTAIEAADIDDGETFVNLSQDTPTTSALKPIGTDLEEYLLLVFDSHDWEVGRTDTSSAVASTELDSVGNWLATPLVISPGTYHIVIRNNFGRTVVISAYLVV